jgi:cullin 1
MDESLLQYYTKQWARYTAAARVVNNIFMYLNRYWVKREIDEDRKSDVYDVFTVCLNMASVYCKLTVLPS